MRGGDTRLPRPLGGLLDPAAYPDRPAEVELRETHISWVLLAGDRAYKLKKPLRLAFLDYGSLQRRRELCHEEVRLNRRLAPGIYRRVCAIVESDGGGVRIAAEDAAGAVEYAVEMVRYDEASTLARRVAAGAAGEADVRAVGARLAGFHAEAAIPAEAERTVPALEAMLEENFASLRDLVADGDEREAVEDAARLAAGVLARRRGELAARARAGRVRDGHGDLRAEHVVLEHGIDVVDCVEFDPALREQDVGLDLAFLVMDLARRDERLARVLLDAYRDAGGDPGDDALVAFFAAQRALIRAKVALVRASQVAGSDARRRRADADALLRMAGRLGWAARLGPLSIVCGASATGKSTLATALAGRAGASRLSSDVVRKALAGFAATERGPETAYTPEASRRTYAELGREAADRLAAGGRVVVDATFRFAADRRAFAAALGPAAGDAVWIECRAPERVRLERAAARMHDAGRVSDADPEVVARQREDWEPLAEIPADHRVVVHTDSAPPSVLRQAAGALDARGRSEP
jgi:aminoglycoside phosphotransferase family enzyme/predicted kinase